MSDPEVMTPDNDSTAARVYATLRRTLLAQELPDGHLRATAASVAALDILTPGIASWFEEHVYERHKET